MKNFPQPKSFPTGAELKDGVWAQVLSPKETTNNRPALFLDRDGVVCVETNYMQNAEDVELTPGAIDVIKSANKKNIPVVLVTNQAGIGYGYFGWDEFANVQARLLDDISSLDGVIDGVFACPFHEKGIPPWDHPSHPARKPNPGMLYMARDLMGVNLSTSWIIGDRSSDILAGKKAGIAGGLHVLSGHGSNPGERENALLQSTNDFVVKSAADISFADDLLPLLREK
ncbi:MAG: HAD-IIIA family hydrolase [Rhodospirillaceae bacterium]|nr:HAD-IIIA family hydrolase [Rhodospirillaceae bacterium]